jgi:hypothetical protein
MPPGTEPTAAAFDVRNVQTPPHPNPEAYWFLTDAVECAVNTIAQGLNHGKEPWIKAGESLFNPHQVRDLYGTIQKMKPRS